MTSTKRLLMAAAVAGCGLAFGWTGPWLYNVCNSAPHPNGSVVVNAEAPDVINPTDVVSATLFYSLDNQATWQSVPMQFLGSPGFDSTFEATIPSPGSGTVWYYVRAQTETNWGTQGPFNAGNAWPVTNNWLAVLAYEPPGDTENDPDGEFLDLTGVGMGRSGDRFYGMLTNHSNSWPTDGGMLGPWYLYTVGFRNADAYAGDSWAYAMTYADAPLGYGSGLYEVNAYSHDFEQIGDIDVSMNGNRLVMRCLISDLTVRHGFQPWPNTGGFLCSAKGDTRSADILLNSWRHDSTNSSRYFVDRTPGFVIGANRAPVLGQARVFPRFGGDTTVFRFNVNYSDADTNLPVLRTVVVDGETMSMLPNHHRYNEAVSYVVTRGGFSVGTHWFHYAFDDGMGVVESAADSFVVEGGTMLAEGRTLDASRFTLDARPNPFSSMVELRGRLRSRVLSVFDHCGKLVARLRQAREGAAVRWDGTDDKGNQLPGGIYFCREEGGPLQRLLVKLGQ